MLQQPNPDDFVLATGETHKVREFVIKSFDAVGIQLKYVPFIFFISFYPLIFLIPRWEGSGEDEHAINTSNGKTVVRVDPAYFRPAEVEYVSKCFVSSGIFFHNRFCSLLLGNPAKAERVLGWKRQVDFDSLVKEMVEADLKAAASLVEDQN